MHITIQIASLVLVGELVFEANYKMQTTKQWIYLLLTVLVVSTASIVYVDSFFFFENAGEKVVAVLT